MTTSRAHMSNSKVLQLIIGAICSVGLCVASLMIGYWVGLTPASTFLGQIPFIILLPALASAVGLALVSVTRPNWLLAISQNQWFLILLCLITFVLGSSISVIPQQQSSWGDRMAGFIPYSDAAGYYKQMLSGPSPSFDEWNSRRPWNSVINIFEFSLTGEGLLPFQLLRVVIAAVALAFFASAVANCVGRTLSLLPLLVLLVWTYPFASSCLSEINGISAASVGTGLYLTALKRRSFPFLFCSVVCCGLAYELRSYNPVWVALLSLLGSIWCLRGSRHLWVRVGGLLLLVVILVAVLKIAPQRAFGAPGGASNYGYVVLGLTRGTNWKEASEYLHGKYPDCSAAQVHVAALSEAVTNLQKNAVPTLTAMGASAAKSLFVSQQEFSCALGFPRHLTGRGPISGTEFVEYIKLHPSIWLSSCVFLVSVLGVCLPHCYPPIRLVAGVSLFSLFSVAPIIFGDGGFRSAASLYPGLSLLALGLPFVLNHCVRGASTPPTTAPRVLGAISPPTPSVDSAGPVHAVGLAVLLFFLAAFPFTWVLKGLNRSPIHGVEIEILAHGPAQWTGWNQAQASRAQLIQWSAQIDGDLKEVIRSHNVLKLRFHDGFVHMVLADTTLTDEEVRTLSSTFQVDAQK